MRNLIFIAHRIPYPPDKGEKIRGLNLLKHLSRTFRIHLGCLIDAPADHQHLPALREWCADVAGFQIDKRRQKLKALAKVRPGRPLMLDYYSHPGLQRWCMRAWPSSIWTLSISSASPWRLILRTCVAQA